MDRLMFNAYQFALSYHCFRGSGFTPWRALKLAWSFVTSEPRQSGEKINDFQAAKRRRLILDAYAEGLRDGKALRPTGSEGEW